ncbi:MAG: 30S ribosome-binding factor RbfA [Gammaproteobacteria bacterium]|nr:30S ribosome-binding factor RbfA [Gammaproteobacteria bacterium]
MPMHEVDRTRRVAELVKRELATIISRELNDNRINSVTITSVTVTKDLKQSVIYVCSSDKKTPSKEIEKLLNNASRFLRRSLCQQVSLRIMPTLLFKYDETIQRGIEMTALIESLNRNRDSE